MADETQREARHAQAGSGEAFARLYERVSPALETWARVRVRGVVARAVDVEDVVQEVWWRALENFDQFRPDQGEFRGWIFGVANNVVREAMRRKGGSTPPSGRIEIEDLEPVLRAQLTSLTGRARRSESVNRLADFVTALPEDEQRLFVHRGLEGLPITDVASIMGISENAVSKRWVRLREKLAPLSVWQEFEADGP